MRVGMDPREGGENHFVVQLLGSQLWENDGLDVGLQVQEHGVELSNRVSDRWPSTARLALSQVSYLRASPANLSGCRREGFRPRSSGVEYNVTLGRKEDLSLLCY
jgi:hypothetical protein